MKEKVYYRIQLELRSSLSIGASDSVQTDVDVVLDSRGLPLIPATSLAGVYRSAFDEERAVVVFGEVLGDTNPEHAQSAVRVFDGTWVGGNGTVSVRDSVSLKDRVAIDGLKFDRQVVERGATFVTYVEIVDTGRCACEDVERVLGLLDAGALRLGGKSSRGMGEVAITSCLRRRFGAGDVDAWLAFDQFADAGSPSWATADDLTSDIRGSRESGVAELRLRLRLRGGISIREYSTQPGTPDYPEPDYGQMVVHGAKDAQGRDVPVIPGTSWAGAFRERFRQFAGEKATRALFGYVDTKGSAEDSRASRISFSESVLEGGEWVQLTRNAIDRFTGGTIDGALYTERAYFGGTTELTLRISGPAGFGPDVYQPLVAVLADLHNGFMAVGGLASVGRGLFAVESAGLWVGGSKREGFQEALVGFDEAGFIAPNVAKVAGMFCPGEGERHE